MPGARRYVNPAMKPTLTAPLLRAVTAAGVRRVLPALLVPWLGLLWFLVNFGPILDWPGLARRLAELPTGVRAALAMGWLLGMAALPRLGVAALLDGDLAFVQRQPLGRVRRGLVCFAALGFPAAVAALPAALWPGPLDSILGFSAAGVVALAAFGRGRAAVAVAAAVAGALAPGWLVAAAAPWVLGAIAEAPRRAPAAGGTSVRWSPPGPIAALCYRELLVLWRGEFGAFARAVAIALPVAALFRGFRRASDFTEAELGGAAAITLAVAGVFAGALAGRLVLRLGWPPVPRAWPVRAPARLIPLAAVVALCLLPTSLAFAAAGVPGSAAAAAPVGLAFVGTCVAAPAAALWSRGRSLGVLLGWSAVAIVGFALGGVVPLLLVAAVAGAVGWAGARAAGRP